MDQEKLWRAEHHTGPPFSIKVNRRRAALLYNLLCDNPRLWNEDIRNQLSQVVSPTDSFNARVENWADKTDTE